MSEHILLQRCRRELAAALRYAQQAAEEVAHLQRELAALRREAMATKLALEDRIVDLPAELFRVASQG